MKEKFINPTLDSINRDVAKNPSCKTVPAHTIKEALCIIGASIAGEITRNQVEETLSKGLQAEYTVRAKKCLNRPGYKVTMTYKERSEGFTAAHFPNLTNIRNKSTADKIQ